MLYLYLCAIGGGGVSGDDNMEGGAIQLKPVESYKSSPKSANGAASPTASAAADTTANSTASATRNGSVKPESPTEPEPFVSEISRQRSKRTSQKRGSGLL